MNERRLSDRVLTAVDSSAPHRRSGNEGLELLTGWAMLEAALWTTGKEQVWLGLAAMATMAAFNYFSACTAWEQGFSLRANRRALWMVPAAIAIGAIMVFAGARGGTLHGWSGYRTPALHAVGYATWAFLQEWMALGFVYVRLERLLSGPYAVLGCAAIFSTAHLPTPVLMAATFVMAALFAWLFRRYRALFPLAFAHALFGLTLSLALPTWVTHFMRVGAAYFR
jgi:membrane protease YdiL (CAAX protease family)